MNATCPLGRGVHHDYISSSNAMPPNAISETVAFLESLARRAPELAASLPSLDLGGEAMAGLAGEVERIAGRLAATEGRLAWVNREACGSIGALRLQ
jgi:hypothetical protein